MFDDRQDLIALYGHCGQEIIFIKGRQWSAVYYILLANAALVAAHEKVLPDIPALGLVIATVLLAGITIRFLSECEHHRAKNKRRMEDCYHYFSAEFRQVIGQRDPDTYTSWALRVVVSVGTVLTILFLLFSKVSGV